MILKNAYVYNSDKEVFSIKNLWIKEHVIFDDSLQDHDFPESEDVVDLSGYYLYPAIIDAHCHLLGTGKSSIGPNLDTIYEKDELIEVLRSCPSEFTILRGWDDSKLGFIPDKAFLDEFHPEGGLLLVRRCGHIGTINSKGIEALSIQELDGLDGTNLSTGILQERALMKTSRKVKFTREQEEKFFQNGAHEYLHNGITMIHSEDWNIHSFPKMIPFLQSQQMIRLNEKVCIHSPEDFQKWVPLRQSLSNKNPFVNSNFVKFYLDGSLGAGTAYLNKPYADHKKNRGVLFHTQEEMVELIQFAEQVGTSVSVHIIGDLALEIALEAFSVSMTKGNPLRHKLIHVQLASSSQLSRIRDMNLYVSIQPLFFESDIEMAPNKLGRRRFESIGYPFQKMHNLSIKISFSSDSPIETCNPFQTLSVSDKWFDRKTAFRYYTTGSALSVFQENTMGSLSVGKWADGFLLKQDLFSLSGDQLKNVKPERILFHGRFL